MNGNGTTHQLLEAAALEGRQAPDLEGIVHKDWHTYGHLVVAPTPRCQECGLRLDLIIRDDTLLGFTHRAPER